MTTSTTRSRLLRSFVSFFFSHKSSSALVILPAFSRAKRNVRSFQARVFYGRCEIFVFTFFLKSYFLCVRELSDDRWKTSSSKIYKLARCIEKKNYNREFFRSRNCEVSFLFPIFSSRRFLDAGATSDSDSEQPSPLAHLSDYHIYKISNAKRYFSAPFEWGACLRPSSNAEAEDTETGVPGLKVIAFSSEKSRACWLTAMRLAKYGKQLRENYRAFKNKQCDQSGGGSPKEQYSSYNVPNESLRSRVAMDFTGSVGRIVEDPKEAKDIAESEGVIWRRRWRPFSRPPPGCAMVRLHGLDGGIHVLQPWFHSGLNRDVAAAIIRDHGSVNGVFLVRESKSNPGAYVLTYKFSEKVFHAQIQPLFDERRNCWLYTLDKGATKFYDLLQLIEFYQLNSGSLPTKLTHYVQNGVTVEQQRNDDENVDGASPSPPSSGNRNSMSPKISCPKNNSSSI